MGEALAAAGARIELFEDGCAIEGPTPLRGVPVRTRLDHRIAMSMAIAQLFMRGAAVQLDDVACVATSFPSFFATLDELSAPTLSGGSSGRGEGAAGAP
jgi:3-phosphoshikimate 1-carboxyvinyltransferase